MLPEDESCVEALEKLGLTFLQAKIYYALSSLGRAEVKKVSKVSSIAKPDIYRVIPGLEKIGLVEKVIATPTIYVAVPIKQGYNLLLQNKNKEMAKLEEQTKRLVDSLHMSDCQIGLNEEDDQIVVTSEAVLALKKLVNQLHATQSSVETMSTWKICGNMLSYYAPDIKRIMKKGVKFRALTDKVLKPEQTPLFLNNLRKDPNFEIRYSAHPIDIKMTIRDKKELNVCVSPVPSQRTPNVWSTNPIFVELAVNCFEHMWNTASE
jgi:Predicted transcriptional regulators